MCYFLLFAFNGAKNGLNILSINSLSQNISFLCTFIFEFALFHIFSACSFQFPRKNFMFSAFFPLCSLSNIFFSLSHCEKKKSASYNLESSRFAASSVCVFFCVYNGVSLWWCHRRRLRQTRQRKRFVLFYLFIFVFCCWDVLLCFTLLSNKSHSFSWTWHLELYFYV